MFESQPPTTSFFLFNKRMLPKYKKPYKNVDLSLKSQDPISK